MVKRIITSVVALAVFVGILFYRLYALQLHLRRLYCLCYMSVTVRQKPMSE